MTEFAPCPAFGIECQYVAEVDRLSAENERLIEQHEAFRQEVSDAAEHLCKFYGVPIVMQQLERFIIAKPDPLEEIIKRNYAGSMSPPQIAYAIRTELDERGLEIREKSE